MAHELLESALELAPRARVELLCREPRYSAEVDALVRRQQEGRAAACKREWRGHRRLAAVVDGWHVATRNALRAAAWGNDRRRSPGVERCGEPVDLRPEEQDLLVECLGGPVVGRLLRVQGRRSHQTTPLGVRSSAGGAGPHERREPRARWPVPRNRCGRLVSDCYQHRARPQDARAETSSASRFCAS